MDELKNIMEIIDRNSNVISDGDYLELCNNIKQLYKVKEGRSTFFNYDETIVSNVSSMYFDYEFYDRAKDCEMNYLDSQIQYLFDEKEYNLPFQRCSKTIKTLVVKHYCEMYEIELDRYEEEYLEQYIIQNNISLGCSFKKYFKKLCSEYLLMENEFRQKYRNALDKRIEYIRHLSLDI
jgi:hypothetical protein